MKCIIRQYKLSGGAPRSLLEHIKVLKTLGFDDIKCMVTEGEKDLYSKYLCEVSELIVRDSLSSLWTEKRYKAVYEELKWEYAFIKKEEPNLVIVLGEIDGALYSRFCHQLGIPLIIYIAGGDLSSNEKVIDLWDHCEVICFSKENCDVIRKHFDEDHINIISNRIDTAILFQDLEQKYKKQQTVIDFLVSSRLDEDKIASIYSFLNMLKMCNLYDVAIDVHIAGDGSQKKALSEYCNNMICDNFHITLLGHLADLTEEFRWAHIIAGKGRSVIEPIMMNRIGCIIGDDSNISFCKTCSFENLFHYNFAGRNIETPSTKYDLQDVIMRISAGMIDDEEILNVSSKTRQYYSTDYLKEKVGCVLGKLNKTEPTGKYPFLWKQFILLIIKKVQGKLK